MTIKMMLTFAAALATLTTAPEASQRRDFQETVTVKGSVRPGLGAHQLTFSAPVALPGLSLGAGTYIFRHAEHNAVQVMSASGDAYAMFLTIPMTRTSPSDGYSIVLGAPGAPGAPRRIVALFAPGETTGQQFVYSTR
jgi:hypothetical protein